MLRPQLLSFDAPFDRYAYAADDEAIGESARRGMVLFFSERLECHHCHGGFNFTQSTTHAKSQVLERPFHNTGLYNVAGRNDYPSPDQGLHDLTGMPEDRGRFRAPTLRNIMLTPPYMHDGSLRDLDAVLDFYAAGGREIATGPWMGDGRLNANKSQFVRGFVLANDEREDLLNFLDSLTDPGFSVRPEYQDPAKNSKKGYD